MKNEPAEKPPHEMTEQELDQAIKRTVDQVRRLKERELVAARQEREESGGGKSWIIPRKRRRPWK